MSIDWYGLKAPVTSIWIESRNDGKTLDFTFWLNHQRSGSMIVRNEELVSLVNLFIDREVIIVSEYYDFITKGAVATWVGPKNFHGQVISELYYSTIVNIDDYLMARAVYLLGPNPVIYPGNRSECSDKLFKMNYSNAIMWRNQCQNQK